MAATAGFSYAQAARGRTSATTSQAPSSKVTSGTATPATGTFSELAPGSNWADDVESNDKDKKEEPQSVQLEERKSSPVTDPVIEQTKSEDTAHQEVSAVSSPDVTASSSTTTKEDDASYAPNASSSESTWETKSQTSAAEPAEPAWIAERSQRQNNIQQSEDTSKHDKKIKDTPAPTPSKPLVLQEAAPPTVNPWLKRAPWNAKPVAISSPTAATLKENQKSASAQATSSPMPSTPLQKTNTDQPSKAAGAQIKRGSEARGGNARQGSKPVLNETRNDSAMTGVTKGTPNGRPTSAKASPAPPAVSDGISWPTPDTVGKERKESVEKGSTEKREDDSTLAGKRQKLQYKQLAVTPTFIFDTTGTTDPRERKPRAPPSGDRPRGSSTRGRGGLRGAGPSERQTARPDAPPTNAQSDSNGDSQDAASVRDREAMPPPPRPTREPSTDRVNARKQSAANSKQTTDSAEEPAKVAKTPNGSFSKPFATVPDSKRSITVDTDGKDEYVPHPIPRRGSASAQTDDLPNRAPKTTRGPPPIRMVSTESRKDNRDAPYTGPRAAKRGGRGRGGARDVVANGHPGTSTYNGTHATEFSSPSSYGVPASPSSYHTSRGNHQFSYPHTSRGSWRGNNMRSHSIPIEQYYGQRYGGAYPDSQQSPHLQGYYPGMYDNNGYPMTAMPYPGYGEADQLWSSIAGQLEYYFSINNLIKDMFLRKHMDSQGFVLLDVVANFPRMKRATQDIDLLQAVCKTSAVVQIRVGEDGKERLRASQGWDKFLLPMDQRDPSAQTDGPKQLQEVETPQVVNTNIPPQYRGPASAGLPYMHQRIDRKSHDSNHNMMEAYHAQFQAYGAYPEAMYGAMHNGGETRGKIVKSPSREEALPPTQQPPATRVESSAAEHDTFSDQQIAILFVAVASEDRPQYRYAATRTFSNGSINSRNALQELDAVVSSTPKPLLNGDAHTNGNAVEETNGFSRHFSPSKTPTTEVQGNGNGNGNVFWVKDRDDPMTVLPRGLTPYPYHKLVTDAMQERGEADAGKCPVILNIFYHFLSHFLVRNFNTSMYIHFQTATKEDARDRNDFTGLEHLVKFYSASLTSATPIRERIAKDYVELVKDEPAELNGAAFKSLRSAWRNGALNLKNRKKLANVLDDSLKEQLDKLDT